MPKIRMTVTGLKCTRCKHEWQPRVPDPTQCPKCHSPYWNKPYVKDVKKAANEKS
jgi:hypothetical protein